LSEPLPTASPALAVTGRLVRPEALRLQGNQTTQLRWLRGDSLEQHYPKAARAAGLDGIVTVDLLVNEAGYVLEAQVIGESPPDAGFGLAALGFCLLGILLFFAGIGWATRELRLSLVPLEEENAYLQILAGHHLRQPSRESLRLRDSA